MTQRSPQKRKGRVTAAFQSGAFSRFPPGSTCLFSSLVVLCLRFSGVAAVPAYVPICFVGEEMLRPWFEPTPAVKMPTAEVRPVSHVPSFGGHCYLGVLRPVPSDDDSSSPRSGSILPSLFSNLTHTSGEGSGVCGLGLQYCTVSTGVTVTCACAASRLRFSSSRYRTANSSSLTFLCSSALTKSIVFCQGLVPVVSAGIEIAFFNFCNSDLKLAVYCRGVGGSEQGP